MRKLLSFGIALLAGAALCAQSVVIEVQGLPSACVVPGIPNTVLVTATRKSSPFDHTAAGESKISYVWMVQHQNGAHFLYTIQPSYAVPVPWTGAYRIRLYAEYTQPGRTRPFAVVPSNQVFIRGVDCSNGSPAR